MSGEEYIQMLNELSKLSPEDLESRKRFLDEWAQLDQMGRELLREIGEKK